MWALRDERYGGRAKRYMKHRGAVVRCVDPIGVQTLAFSTLLHFENWLLHYARPDVVAVDANPAPLEYLHQGRLKRLRFDLLLRLNTGIREIQLVVRHDDARVRAQCTSLQEAASSFGFVFVPRPRELVRANRTLLDNVGRLRQLLVAHSDSISSFTLNSICEQVHQAGEIKRGQLSEGEMSSLIAHPQCVDAALFKLYVARRVRLNLDEVPYGNETIINALE